MGTKVTTMLRGISNPRFLLPQSDDSEDNRNDEEEEDDYDDDGDEGFTHAGKRYTLYWFLASIYQSSSLNKSFVGCCSSSSSLPSRLIFRSNKFLNETIKIIVRKWMKYKEKPLHWNLSH